MLTDGPWDLQFLMCKEARKHGIRLQPHWRRYLDLQRVFARAHPHVHHHPGPSLRFMARYLRVPVEGRHHCGLDDCMTIANILKAMLSSGNAELDE